MTMPAACLPAERTSPSSLSEVSMSSLPISRSLYRAWNSFDLARVSCSSFSSMSLLISLARWKGMSMARATSLMTALAYIVLKVMIWLTWSSPYLSRT